MGLYIGLLHYPIKNRLGEIVTGALTGLDIHDIARSARTYGVERYYLITPLKSQREIAEKIKDYWLKSKVGHNRGEALNLVEIKASYEESLKNIKEMEGKAPITVGTSARQSEAALVRTISYNELAKLIEKEPIYILFGTGWGIAESLLCELDYMLPPIWGTEGYNHLSVRAAAAIILDRLRGR
jgi:hypothetical protein